MGLPIIVIIEAKQNDFTEGWGQCLAELLASQGLNQIEGEQKEVYGIVTDGEVWQFGKLSAKLFTKNRTRITINELDKIFGAIVFLLSQRR